MFAIYDKITKKFLYSTEKNPVEVVTNPETGEAEEKTTLPDGLGAVEFYPPPPSPDILRWEYDEEKNTMVAIARPPEDVEKIKAKIAAEKEKNEKISKIAKIKKDLEKFKEDVEQVELFSMTREDYAEKKELCKNMILQLRELERSLTNGN